MTDFKLKAGDRYCIADLMVESHGIMVHDGRKHSRQIKDDDFRNLGREYLEVSHPDVLVPVEEFGKFWLNTEPRKGHKMNVWYLVYPANMPTPEFEALLKSEIERVVSMHVQMYEKLLANAKIIHERVQTSQWEPQQGYSRAILIKENANG